MLLGIIFPIVRLSLIAFGAISAWAIAEMAGSLTVGAAVACIALASIVALDCQK